MLSLMEKDETMGKTVSTAFQRTHHKSLVGFSSRKRPDMRLNSTLRVEPQNIKFTQIGKSSMSWKKWKVSQFPHVWDSFKNKLQRTVLKNKGDKVLNRQGPSVTELKLRHQIREVTKLRLDIKKARENNKLILQIEDFHQKKVNQFFDSHQKHFEKAS